MKDSQSSLKEKSDIICLQEIHLHASEERCLKELYGGKTYHAAAPVKERVAYFIM